MRIPLNQFYHPVRDERKHIMFIGDIFDSKKDAALIPVMKLLDKEYCCMHVELFRNPSQTLMSIKCSCMADEYKPDLIVAYGSGATLAAQVEGIEKVLIKPYYHTSNMLASILGEKGQKQRIELPTLGQPEYLTVIRPMVWEWQKLEENAMQNGYNNDAHSLFFAPDIETATYKEHMKLFGDAMTVPGESIRDPKGIENVATFIKGVLEAKRTDNDCTTILAAVNELCTNIINKQIANQIHIPDEFEGVKEIKTRGYEVGEMEPGKLCTSVVKTNDEWHVCSEEGKRLPMKSLGLQSLHNVEEALLKVWKDILDWEAQWE